MKKVLILGCTGSIGQNTLDIIRSHPDEFRLAGLQAHANETQLLADGADFPGALLCLSSRSSVSDRIGYVGSEGILKLIEDSGADIVVNGIVGASGLRPSVQTLECGMDLALANKESMVLAGPQINHLASIHGKRLLPVDSEHSALFQLLDNRRKDQVSELILTASGGPFRNRAIEDFPSITLKDALAHPTWDMGAKITIDSATMANKGLEVIEAKQLFDFDINKINVLIHPQSYVHSLIRTRDMALYAQISKPDMRLPIQNALFYPAMKEVPWTYMDLTDKILEFYKPDLDKFPMLGFAFECARLDGAYSIAYNAANEIAVEAFLRERISFTTITAVTNHVLSSDWSMAAHSIDEIIDNDSKARRAAESYIGSIIK